LGSIILVSFFTAPLFYFFVIRPYRELAEQRVSLMNNLPGVVYRGHRDWSVSFMGAQVEQVTGYTADAIHDYFVLHPGFPFLQKPFDLSSLARKVREVLDR
jgi:hypothetical protein